MKKIELTLKKSGKLLKVLERECPDVLYSALSEALRNKDIIVDGQRTKQNISVFEGSKVTIYVKEESQKQLFSVFYGDDNILIVNKDKGIEVSDGDFNVVSELKKQGISALPVHRIDRNTTGLVVFAKNKQAEKELLLAFKNQKIDKFYLAEVVGTPPKQHDILKSFLLKDKDTALVKIFQNKVPGAEKITTEYWVLKTSGNTSLLQVKISEGKTHQIRAQLAKIGNPIIGDGKYGKNEDNKKYKEKSQKLRANKICFKFDKQSPLNYLNNLTFELDDKF